MVPPSSLSRTAMISSSLLYPTIPIHSSIAQGLQKKGAEWSPVRAEKGKILRCMMKQFQLAPKLGLIEAKQVALGGNINIAAARQKICQVFANAALAAILKVIHAGDALLSAAPRTVICIPAEEDVRAL